ncbi:hypothetical protein BpHYR1_023417 [Brachionus plicatilis]|uniref:Uncharacterized protein n=1 Tax=Brachionus plicatilis TaxID=10195 RepID=A0A3M7QZ20_BRAPC|nr:hypothetical protein BpHYR1_023417 [Brachionus plicatilis]
MVCRIHPIFPQSQTLIIINSINGLSTVNQIKLCQLSFVFMCKTNDINNYFHWLLYSNKLTRRMPINLISRKKRERKREREREDENEIIRIV